MSSILALDNVSLGYGQRTILKDISLTVAQGEVVALMGGSGSGKTTLLRAATGQLKARSGSIKLFGQEVNSFDIESLREARQRMGVLFQQGALFTDLNVFENYSSFSFCFDVLYHFNFFLSLLFSCLTTINFPFQNSASFLFFSITL